MNPKQLRELLESAALSQSEAARQLGITDRTMRRYVSGKADVPQAIEYAVLYLLGQKKRVDAEAAKISATGKTVTFTTTVSRRQADKQFMLTWRDGKRVLFQTTVSDSGARAHRHLYGKLTALLEGLK